MAIDNSLARGFRKRILRDMADVEARIKAAIVTVRCERPTRAMKEMRNVLLKIRSPWTMPPVIAGPRRKKVLTMDYLAPDRIVGNGGIGLNRATFFPEKSYTKGEQLYFRCSAHALERIIQASADDFSKVAILVHTVMFAAITFAVSENKESPARRHEIFVTGDGERKNDVIAVVIMELDEEIMGKSPSGGPVYAIKTVLPGGDRLDPRHLKAMKNADQIVFSET